MGTHFGIIPTTKFASCITDTFAKLALTEAQILQLVTAYGLGAYSLGYCSATVGPCKSQTCTYAES